MILNENIHLGSMTNKPNKNQDIHFSKNLLDLLNKYFTSSSLLNNMPQRFWFNNKKVYHLIETGVCDYYTERLIKNDFKFYTSLK